MTIFFASKLLICRQKWTAGVRHDTSLVVRRVWSGRIIVVLFWTKYAFPRQIKPGIFKLTTCRGHSNLLTVFSFVNCEEKGCYRVVSVGPGAIIRDGDRKRAPFLVLGLAPWYGTIFLFLEQIAPSPAAQACTLLRGFSRMSRRGNGVRNSRNRLCFWPTTQGLNGCWNFA